MRGVQIRSLRHLSGGPGFPEESARLPKDVSNLSRVMLERVFAEEEKAGRPLKFSRFFVCTTTPDRLCPSLGQMLQSMFPTVLSRVPTHDIVQGCAASITTLSLAAEWVAATGSRVLFLAADTAGRAVSTRSSLHSGFSDGAFGCVIEPTEDASKGLLKHCTIHYSDVRDVVLVELGHRTRDLLKDLKDQDLEDALGLKFDRRKALQLAGQAKAFSEEFFEGQSPADHVILHQVNPKILEEVRKDAFAKQPGFIDRSHEVGNCGVATVGVVLSLHWDQVQGRKVFLCSFGTGGVITGSYWQL